MKRVRAKKQPRIDLPIACLHGDEEKPMMKAVGVRVKHLRKTIGYSQEQMAAVLGIHQTAICRVEKGQQSLSATQLLYMFRIERMVKTVLITTEGETLDEYYNRCSAATANDCRGMHDSHPNP